MVSLLAFTHKLDGVLAALEVLQSVFSLGVVNHQVLVERVHESIAKTSFQLNDGLVVIGWLKDAVGVIPDGTPLNTRMVLLSAPLSKLSLHVARVYERLTLFRGTLKELLRLSNVAASIEVKVRIDEEFLHPENPQLSLEYDIQVLKGMLEANKEGLEELFS